MVVGGIGYFLTVELTSTAVQITDYTDNIAAKITALRGSTPEWLQRIEDGIKDVGATGTKAGAQAKTIDCYRAPGVCS